MQNKGITLNELQNHIETLASYVNASIFEITPVHVHASVIHQLFVENNVRKNAMKSLLETHSTNDISDFPNISLTFCHRVIVISSLFFIFMRVFHNSSKSKLLT